jgi:hypothetical membrane protein
MQASEPGMDPAYAPISLYARLRHGWMLCVALLLMAAAVAIYSRAYQLLVTGSKGVPRLLWLSIAIVLAAMFRAHTYFPWEGPPTLVGTLHMICSVCAFMLFAAAAFAISSEQPRRMLKVLTAAFFLASGFSCAEAGMTLLLHQKPQYMGLEERVILFIALIWFFALFQAADRPVGPPAG